MQRTESLERTGEQLTREGKDFINKASDKTRETVESVGDKIAGASETPQGKLKETGRYVGVVLPSVSDKTRPSVQYLEDSRV